MHLSYFLSFSDAAKFADVAKNIYFGKGFGLDFSFFGTKVFTNLTKAIFSARGIPPVTPYSIDFFFKIFGVGDFAVIATSFFYFLLTLVFVYLLASKIFKSKLTAVLSTMAIGSNYDLIHYAVSGASESPLIFEIVATSYFASLRNKWANIGTFLFLILMYFTRPQAFIYIIGIVLYWLLINFNIKKTLIYFTIILLLGLLVDHFILLPLSSKNFFYSIIGRGLSSSFNQSGVASNVLRGGAVYIGISQVIKNIFYNLYNFYKLLPQIFSPYIFALFLIGLIRRSKDKIQDSFRIATMFMVIVTLLVTAASIPFFRYIHPVIPLIYIISVGTLVELLSLFSANKFFVITSSVFLILFFAVGQTLGMILLDSRFERNTHNVGKPPVYVQLSYLLRDNTTPGQVIVTNLDTWGSWYGERKTVWFPLEPKQLINSATGKIPFDAIFLTSYLIDDPNYYMGKNWRVIFENPKDPRKWSCDGCEEIVKEYKLKDVYVVPASDNYEKQDSNAVLLIKK